MTQPCLGCGALLPPEDGPTHRYMLSSPACWRRYGEVLAAEYSDAALLEVHRLSVDAYAVQHPGDGSRQAIQSVGLHLARLLVQLESPRPPKQTNDVMLSLGRRKATLVELTPPTRFSMTVADVAPHAGTPRHAELVREWAAATWADWEEHHATVRAWVEAG